MLFRISAPAPEQEQHNGQLMKQEDQVFNPCMLYNTTTHDTTKDWNFILINNSSVKIKQTPLLKNTKLSGTHHLWDKIISQSQMGVAKFALVSSPLKLHNENPSHFLTSLTKSNRNSIISRICWWGCCSWCSEESESDDLCCCVDNTAENVFSYELMMLRYHYLTDWVSIGPSCISNGPIYWYIT